MTRGWAKSLLFKIAIGAVVLFAFLSCVQSASASIVTDPSSIDVSFSFDQTIGSKDYSTDEYFTITISGNDTLNIEPISDDNGKIKITPYPSSFSLEDGKSKSIKLTIGASSYAGEKTYTEEVLIKNLKGEMKGKVTVRVKITYCAKLEVSPSPIDFGRVGSKESKESETITISEVYKYKAAKGVTIEKISGNDWVTIKGTLPNQIEKGSSATITFQIISEKYPISKNEYSWKYRVEYTTSDGKRDSITIPIEAYILMPPKLGRLYDKDLEIKFDKPKGTVSTYERVVEVKVRNLGDEPMGYTCSLEQPAGIHLRTDRSTGSVSRKGYENIKVYIIVPYDTPEDTYRGKLSVNAGDAGREDMDITIKIIWPVDFIISSTSIYFTQPPPSIDFGSIELKERGYEKKSANITLTEFYLYKPVRNLRFSTSGEYGKWLNEERDFYEIPPGESRNITLKIEPGLEAVPKNYSWAYAISASEISAKRIEVKAKIVPLNITRMIEDFDSFRETPLYNSYPSSEVIISNGVGMLEVVERTEIGAEDWKKTSILMKSALSLLSSLNDGIIFTEEEKYGEAVENLLTASASTSTIESNSNLNNRDISGYAKDISTGADKTTEEVLRDEAKMLELRAWNIKKAVEHATAMDDISGLKEEENVLESAISYQCAATIHGLLNDMRKRLECSYEESRMMDKHEELVSDATHFRIEAEKNILNSRENDLIRIGDIYLLLDPYKYDTFSANYGQAEKYLEDALKKYKVAGIKEDEPLFVDTKEELNKLRNERMYILFLFLLACILYGAAFIYTISRVIMGTMAYMRDMYEREAGDIVVT